MLKKILPMIFLLGCAACSKDPVEVEVADPDPITWSECGYEMGDHPCDFTLKDQHGEDWNLYDNYGSLIVLDFSAEWCYYCQVAALDAQTVQDAYAEEGLIYVTIMIEDSSGNPANEGLLTRWSDHFGITSPVLEGSRDLLDTGDGEGWLISGWPTFYFIDKEMVLSKVMRGYSDETMLTIIDLMLIEEADEAEQ
jgi:thiol-disulfide isomerase/thioredoxin